MTHFTNNLQTKKLIPFRQVQFFILLYNTQLFNSNWFQRYNRNSTHHFLLSKNVGHIFELNHCQKLSSQVCGNDYERQWNTGGKWLHQTQFQFIGFSIHMRWSSTKKLIINRLRSNRPVWSSSFVTDSYKSHCKMATICCYIQTNHLLQTISPAILQKRNHETNTYYFDGIDRHLLAVFCQR